MKQQICLNEENFKEMEKTILKQVMDTSKSMIETFKFRMLFGTQVSPKQNQKTLRNLREFRSKNWDAKLNRDDAYNKYINLY